MELETIELFNRKDLMDFFKVKKFKAQFIFFSWLSNFYFIPYSRFSKFNASEFRYEHLVRIFQKIKKKFKLKKISLRKYVMFNLL